MNLNEMLLRLERAGLRREAATAAIAAGSALTGVGLLTLQSGVLCCGLVILTALAIVAKGPGNPQHPVPA